MLPAPTGPPDTSLPPPAALGGLATPAARHRRGGRGLIVVAVAAALASAGLAAAAVIGAADDPDEATLVVGDVVATTPPPTVAPLPPPGDGTYAAEPAAADVVDVDVDDGLSPLADLLDPPTSAIPEPIAARPRPVGVTSDRIEIERFPVRAVGLEPDGQMEIPDETEIGWYRYGATAGRPGATVLAAHVSWNGTTGPFFRLGTKEPGDRIVVTLDDGTVREYEVVERTMYDKDELPRDRIWRNTGPESLVLITCGGDFNPEIRRYRQNIVVYAVPVG